MTEDAEHPRGLEGTRPGPDLVWFGAEHSTGEGGESVRSVSWRTLEEVHLSGLISPLLTSPDFSTTDLSDLGVAESLSKRENVSPSRPHACTWANLSW